MFEPHNVAGPNAEPDVIADQPAAPPLGTFDLVAHLHRQREFSVRTFGPGERVEGVVDHIRRELVEVEARPSDLTEWIDIVLLALDGAHRQGYSPEKIASALADKQNTNESRVWPDWRTAEPGKAIEHIRDHDPASDA